MRYALIVSAGLGAVLLFLLSTASGDTEFLTKNYPLLLALNLALTLVLAWIVGYQLWTLARKLRAGVFGSRLTLRFVLLFSLMAVGPGLLVYAVSVQFIAKSIESWFDIRVDSALESGLSLGRTVLDSMVKDVTAKADAMAVVLAEVAPGAERATLLRLREQVAVADAALFNGTGAVIAVASAKPGDLLPALPDQGILRRVRMQEKYGAIDTLPERGLFVRVVVPVNILTLTEDIRFLQLLEPVPEQLARDAESVQEIYRDYQEILLSRKGLKRLFAVTLTLSLIMALFAAFGLAFVFSDRLGTPLANLAEGTRAVAQGDFSQRHPVRSTDELGVLTESFNAMTRQLADARAAADRGRGVVEAARAYLESILASLSSGVLSFDEDFRLASANPAAAEILGRDLEPVRQVELSRWGSHDPALGDFADQTLQALASTAVEWEHQIERKREESPQVLLARGTRLPEVTGGGFVVVFDDITGLLEAQRAAAWGEVARRMAHEVKNPLTPIRLSAERLRHKLASKVDPRDAEMLERSTQTIISQVDAMKGMVDAFSQYARTPETQLRPLDVNAVVREVLGLYEGHGVEIRQRLGETLPMVLGDHDQLRQVIHNLVQNAEDAVEREPGPVITVSTGAIDGRVRLGVADNGEGFPEHILARAFEPYVTTKPRGTGLGLAIVRKIVEEHHGMIQIEKAEPRGTRVSVTLPAAEKV